nr:Splicing factor 3B subunit 1 [Polyrhizophydium stewartii]
MDQQDIDAEIRKAQELRKSRPARRRADPAADTQLPPPNAAVFDSDIYDASSNIEGFVTSLPAGDADDDEDTPMDDADASDPYAQRRMRAALNAPRDAFADVLEASDPAADGMGAMPQSRRIADREGEYRARRLNRQLSPERGSGGHDSEARSYSQVMRDVDLDRERERTLRRIQEKQKEELERQQQQQQQPGGSATAQPASDAQPPAATPRRRRWDQVGPSVVATPESMQSAQPAQPKSEWEVDDQPTQQRGADAWGETPVSAATSGEERKRTRWDETPAANAYAATPVGGSGVGATPKRSRWDQTPVGVSQFGATPIGGAGMATPVPGMAPVPMTPEAANNMRWEKEIEQRNRYLTDEELDDILPKQGYAIVDPPASYVPIRTPARKLMATPTPMAGSGGFMMQEEDRTAYADTAQEIPGMAGLQFVKPEDMQHFAKLLDKRDDSELSSEEAKERRIMRLLLKIKNGTPPVRKTSLRQITDRAREFGPGPLFNQILPLLMSPSLEDQERHLLVKVIDRVLYKLDDLVRPYVHKILVVIEPLLIDEDFYARVEGREIISNLSKAAGLATMIATMRPDIDHVDEYVRNTTARAFAVVASALGIPALLPFLKAVCRSTRSWQARHTGIKIVQQIAILLGCAILPHLRSLVEAIAKGLEDEQQKVKTIAALAIAALAEAAAPYGIESFDIVIESLWEGVKKHRGKGRAAFLKAIGYIIPLMEERYANEYTKNIVPTLIAEFASPDEEMKKIVLKVVKQCVGTDGVDAKYIRDEILPEFFRNFWVRRMALDRRNYKQLVETTVEIAQKVGVTVIVEHIVGGLKDESEAYRKMTMETIDSIVQLLGTADIDPKLESQLVDGMLTAFQEQTVEDAVMLNGFGTVVNSLGLRIKPYLPQVCSTILWRLSNKSAKVRQQAADLISRVAVVIRTCGEEKLMAQMGKVLFEYLGEEYPEVLGSILKGLKAIVNVIGMSDMEPPIRDLLPRLTPILKNRHEKVQENCIDLVGRIADRGAEFVSAREWMRICFELLDLLKAHKKGIRRATVNTFGYIAKAIGPQDVLATLLNNLKVQERQNRVCTTVAIAIVAETCAPFTVLPALMNEYRLPELNVQNGVLKSLSFVFEYIGEMGKDYVYAVTPLLEDALIDRDLVHRQTACTTIKHIALGIAGLGCEDALVHLLNHVWPNIFETSPHVINAVMDAIEGMRIALGPSVILNYVLQGLFHPARRVREIYWKIYNNLYMGSQDALVPMYPRIEDDHRNKYERHELDYVI